MYNIYVNENVVDKNMSSRCDVHYKEAYYTHAHDQEKLGPKSLGELERYPCIPVDLYIVHR